jgi:prepilin-type N-cleavage/methylation domain protein
VRDARMAGNFGCFNMSGFDDQVVIQDFGSADLFKLKGTGSILPAVRETDSLGLKDFTPSGKALIFQYGIDAQDPPAETAVASNCTNITKPGTKITDGKAALKSDSSQAGNISIMKHEVNAYAVGTVDGQEGLYRFQLADNGTWSNPQLLIKGIKNMDIHYFYTEECPETFEGSEAASAPTPTTAGNAQNQGTSQEKDEKFKYTKEFSNKETPASIEILLNGGNSINVGKNNDKNEVQIYRINATVRGGNKCADRLL